jgi:predicted RNase H-like HicB family nuclease
MGLGYKRVTLESEVWQVMRIKVVLEASDEGGYTAYVPSLPGCISEGENIQESLANISEAIALYLEPTEDDWVAAAPSRGASS